MDNKGNKFILNTRSQKIIESLKYNQIQKEEKEKFKLLVDDDKKLTLIYQEMGSNLLNLTFESMAILLNKRDINRLFALKFSEFESFLRDQNIKPAYLTSEEELLSVEFYKLKTFLVTVVLELELDDYQVSKEYMAILRLVHRLFFVLNGHFNQGESIKFLHFESKNLYYSSLKQSESSLYLSAISEILYKKLGQKINLVAV